MNERLRIRFERLEAVRRRIESRIDGVASATLNRPPDPGRWSAAQVISHIVLAESRTLDYVHKKSSDPSQLRPVGLKQTLKSKFVIAVMSVPVRLSAPALVATVSENEDPVELCERWARVRGDLGTLLDSIPDSLLGTGLFRHPVGGPMTLESALDFMVAHATRHAKQIERALENAGK